MDVTGSSDEKNDPSHTPEKEKERCSKDRRRTSILKPPKPRTPLQVLQFNGTEENKDARSSRRVSFGRLHVQEFLATCSTVVWGPTYTLEAHTSDSSAPSSNSDEGVQDVVSAFSSCTVSADDYKVENLKENLLCIEKTDIIFPQENEKNKSLPRSENMNKNVQDDTVNVNSLQTILPNTRGEQVYCSVRSKQTKYDENKSRRNSEIFEKSFMALSQSVDSSVDESNMDLTKVVQGLVLQQENKMNIIDNVNYVNSDSITEGHCQNKFDLLKKCKEQDLKTFQDLFAEQTKNVADTWSSKKFENGNKSFYSTIEMDITETVNPDDQIDNCFYSGANYDRLSVNDMDITQCQGKLVGPVVVETLEKGKCIQPFEYPTQSTIKQNNSSKKHSAKKSEYFEKSFMELPQSVESSQDDSKMNLTKVVGGLTLEQENIASININEDCISDVENINFGFDREGQSLQFTEDDSSADIMKATGCLKSNKRRVSFSFTDNKHDNSATDMESAHDNEEVKCEGYSKVDPTKFIIDPQVNVDRDQLLFHFSNKSCDNLNSSTFPDLIKRGSNTCPEEFGNISMGCMDFTKVVGAIQLDSPKQPFIPGERIKRATEISIHQENAKDSVEMYLGDNPACGENSCGMETENNKHLGQSIVSYTNYNMDITKPVGRMLLDAGNEYSFTVANSINFVNKNLKNGIKNSCVSDSKDMLMIAQEDKENIDDVNTDFSEVTDDLHIDRDVADGEEVGSNLNCILYLRETAHSKNTINVSFCDKLSSSKKIITTEQRNDTESSYYYKADDDEPTDVNFNPLLKKSKVDKHNKNKEPLAFLKADSDMELTKAVEQEKLTEYLEQSSDLICHMNTSCLNNSIEKYLMNNAESGGKEPPPHKSSPEKSRPLECTQGDKDMDFTNVVDNQQLIQDISTSSIQSSNSHDSIKKIVFDDTNCKAMVKYQNTGNETKESLCFSEDDSDMDITKTADQEVVSEFIEHSSPALSHHLNTSLWICEKDLNNDGNNASLNPHFHEIYSEKSLQRTQSKNDIAVEMDRQLFAKNRNSSFNQSKNSGNEFQMNLVDDTHHDAALSTEPTNIDNKIRKSLPLSEGDSDMDITKAVDRDLDNFLEHSSPGGRPGNTSCLSHRNEKILDDGNGKNDSKNPCFEQTSIEKVQTEKCTHNKIDMAFTNVTNRVHMTENIEISFNQCDNSCDNLQKNVISSSNCDSYLNNSITSAETGNKIILTSSCVIDKNFTEVDKERVDVQMEQPFHVKTYNNNFCQNHINEQSVVSDGIGRLDSKKQYDQQTSNEELDSVECIQSNQDADLASKVDNQYLSEGVDNSVKQSCNGLISEPHVSNNVKCVYDNNNTCEIKVVCGFGSTDSSKDFIKDSNKVEQSNDTSCSFHNEVISSDNTKENTKAEEACILSENKSYQMKFACEGFTDVSGRIRQLITNDDKFFNENHHSNTCSGTNVNSSNNNMNSIASNHGTYTDLSSINEKLDSTEFIKEEEKVKNIAREDNLIVRQSKLNSLKLKDDGIQLLVNNNTQCNRSPCLKADLKNVGRVDTLANGDNRSCLVQNVENKEFCGVPSTTTHENEMHYSLSEKSSTIQFGTCNVQKISNRKRMSSDTRNLKEHAFYSKKRPSNSDIRDTDHCIFTKGSVEAEVDKNLSCAPLDADVSNKEDDKLQDAGDMDTSSDQLKREINPTGCGNGNVIFSPASCKRSSSELGDINEKVVCSKKLCTFSIRKAISGEIIQSAPSESKELKSLMKINNEQKTNEDESCANINMLSRVDNCLECHSLISQEKTVYATREETVCENPGLTCTDNKLIDAANDSCVETSSFDCEYMGSTKLVKKSLSIYNKAEADTEVTKSVDEHTTKSSSCTVADSCESTHLWKNKVVKSNESLLAVINVKESDTNNSGCILLETNNKMALQLDNNREYSDGNNYSHIMSKESTKDLTVSDEKDEAVGHWICDIHNLKDPKATYSDAMHTQESTSYSDPPSVNNYEFSKGCVEVEQDKSISCIIIDDEIWNKQDDKINNVHHTNTAPEEFKKGINSADDAQLDQNNAHQEIVLNVSSNLNSPGHKTYFQELTAVIQEADMTLFPQEKCNSISEGGVSSFNRSVSFNCNENSRTKEKVERESIKQSTEPIQLPENSSKVNLKHLVGSANISSSCEIIPECIISTDNQLEQAVGGEESKMTPALKQPFITQQGPSCEETQSLLLCNNKHREESCSECLSSRKEEENPHFEECSVSLYNNKLLTQPNLPSRNEFLHPTLSIPLAVSNSEQQNSENCVTRIREQRICEDKRPDLCLFSKQNDINKANKKIFENQFGENVVSDKKTTVIFQSLQNKIEESMSPVEVKQKECSEMSGVLNSVSKPNMSHVIKFPSLQLSYSSSSSKCMKQAMNKNEINGSSKFQDAIHLPDFSSRDELLKPTSEELLIQRSSLNRGIWSIQELKETLWIFTFLFKTLQLNVCLVGTSEERVVNSVNTVCHLKDCSRQEVKFVLNVLQKKIGRRSMSLVNHSIKEIPTLLDKISTEIEKIMLFLVDFDWLHTIHGAELSGMSVSFKISSFKLRTLFKLTIDLKDWERVPEDNIYVEKIMGDVRQKEIKNLANGIRKGPHFLKEYFQAIDEYLKVNEKYGI